MNKIITILAFGLLPILCLGNTYYVDPIHGSMENDGSLQAPWSTLQEVLEQNLIESLSNSPLPFDAQNNAPKIKNNGAPIKAGDTIVLNSGLHGNIFIRNYNNAEYITIIGGVGERPVIEQLRVQAGSRWRFENLIISSEPYGYYIQNTLVFFESHGWQGPVKNIEIKNCEIFSAEEPWTTADDWITKVSNGIRASGDSIHIINNTFENVDMGISAGGDYIHVINNAVINFSGDGLRILGSYGLFEGNLIKNCYNVDENHDDGIQSFTTNGIVVDHNIVRGNTIINQEDPDQPLSGPLQGIGCFDGFYNNWIVENNLISVNHWHGITFLGANNCTIINNTVLDPSPQVEPGGSWIRIANHKDGRPSSGCIVKNNVINKLVVDGETTNNFMLNNLSEYDEHFVNAGNYNFSLLPGSALIDAADDSIAPETDIKGVIRPQGEHSDIGCHEYAISSSNHPVIKEENTIKIFPNPSNGLIYLDVMNFKNYTVKIIDSRGRLIHHEHLTNKALDISKYPIGLYFFNLNNMLSNEEHSYKIIKQ